jgi:hypothetical protein
MDHKKIWRGVVNWIYLVKRRDKWVTLVNKVMKIQIPWKAGNFLTSRAIIIFWREVQQRVIRQERKQGKDISIYEWEEVKYTVPVGMRNKGSYIYCTWRPKVFMFFSVMKSRKRRTFPLLHGLEVLEPIWIFRCPCSIFNSCLANPSIIAEVEGCKERGR